MFRFRSRIYTLFRAAVTISLNARISYICSVGKTNLTIRQKFINSLEYCNTEGILKFKARNGQLNNWVQEASDYKVWTKMAEKSRKVRIINEVYFYKTYYN